MNNSSNQPQKAEPEESKQNPNSQVSAKPYNPSKLPTYIGLFIKDSYLPQVNEYIVNGMQRLAETYKSDEVIVKAYEQAQNNDHSSLEPVKDLHVTTLFIGGNGKLKSSEYFTSFQPDYTMSVDIVALVVVPGKIVTGICFPDQSVIKINNEFPHITLMKGGWAPKFSNDLVEALCGKGGALEKEYKKGFDMTEEFFYKGPVKVAKGNATAYVIKIIPNFPVNMKAESR